jgi:hypothetical protein
LVAVKAAVAIVAAAAIAALAALLLAHSGSTPPFAPTAPLAVRAAFDRTIAGFGDPVTARVVIEVDRRAVEASTLRFTTDLAPLTLLSPARVTRTILGRLETVSIVQRAACITAPCLAGVVTVHPVHVSVTTRAGALSSPSPAVELQLRGRVTAKDLAAVTPNFTANVAPPTPSYRISPSTAAPLLDVIAALAAAGAAALVVLQALAVRRNRRPEETRDELARALRLAREAEVRPAPDRRRAIALLARLLRNREGRLGAAASDLAWSEPAPDPQAIAALVADVERERTG